MPTHSSPLSKTASVESVAAGDKEGEQDAEMNSSIPEQGVKRSGEAPRGYFRPSMLEDPWEHLE